MRKLIFWSFLAFGLLFSASLFSQSLVLNIIGTSDEDTKIIDSFNPQKEFKDYQSLKKEVDFISSKLQKSGYLESELLSIYKENDSTHVAQFNLNSKYATIRISYGTFFSPKILESISDKINKDTFEITFETLEETLTYLNTQLSNEGDPFSSLQLKNIIKKNTTTLTAELEIVSNTPRTIDKIIVKGYEKFPKSYLKRFLKLKTNSPFNLNSIKEKTAILNDLQFASQIKDPEVLFTKDSTTLYIYVEKTKSNAFDGFLGFGTSEESNKLEFDGYLNLNLVNNLNYGESLKLYYKSDESEQKTFDVNVKLPYLFSSPIGMDLSLNIFKKDSSFITATQTAKLFYQINSKNQVSLGTSSTTSSNLLDAETTTITDYTSNYYSLNFTHNTQQLYDILFPTNFLFNLSGGIGNRETSLESLQQKKLELDTYKIFNFNPYNSIYLRLNGAYLQSNDYLENELFRFGGINSIRGFEENTLTANLYSVFNTEYRYRVNNSLYVHTVFDAAYFENQFNNTKGKLLGFGFGFGLLTKSGLFKLNYSSGKTENQNFKLSNSKLHISLSTVF
ncbi:POTRA domain-containing protein [Lacinutrix undariae]